MEKESLWNVEKGRDTGSQPMEGQSPGQAEDAHGAAEGCLGFSGGFLGTPKIPFKHSLVLISKSQKGGLSLTAQTGV